MGERRNERALRQIRLTATLKRQFKSMALSRNVLLENLYDEAVLDFLNDVKGQPVKSYPWLSQPRSPSGSITNVSLSCKTIEEIDTHLNTYELAHVTQPTVIYTALIHWANKYNFKFLD